MNTQEAILTRRSIRTFNTQRIPKEWLETILTAGTYAPYGRNELWRLAVIQDAQLKKEIAELTIYKKFVGTADTLIAVFADDSLGYHLIKDSQTIGAFIQNILLSAHDLGLGAVWIGEILKNSDKVAKLCQAKENYTLHAVIALGFPAETKKSVHKRLPLADIVFFTAP